MIFSKILTMKVKKLFKSFCKEFNEDNMSQNIDLKKWQENWEEEDLTDPFEKILKKEISLRLNSK